MPLQIEIDRSNYDDHIEIEYRISKIYLPAVQANTKASSDIEGEEIGKIVTDLVQSGNCSSELRLHWHSHNDMSVFHSGTDNENYDDLKTGDFLVSIVANKKNEMLGRVDYYKPFNVIYNNLPIMIKMVNELGPHVQNNIDKVKENESKSLKPINLYSDKWSSKNFKDDNKWDKKETSFNPTGYNNYIDIQDEILDLCYENLAYLEDSGDIALVHNNLNDPVGFRKIATNTYHQLAIVPLCKTEMEYYQKGVDNVQ